MVSWHQGQSVAYVSLHFPPLVSYINSRYCYIKLVCWRNAMNNTADVLFFLRVPFDHCAQSIVELFVQVFLDIVSIAAANPNVITARQCWRNCDSVFRPSIVV